MYLFFVLNPLHPPFLLLLHSTPETHTHTPPQKTGTGNNNKINFLINDKQEMIDIIETVYRGARKGRGLVVSPKDYSTKYRY
jgi:hypothetical protein